MYIGNNYQVSVKLYNDFWVHEQFIDEKSAKDFANEAYTQMGAVIVELMKRHREGGYISIKKVTQNKLVAISKRVAYLQCKYEADEKKGIKVYDGEFENLKKIIANINAE